PQLNAGLGGDDGWLNTAWPRLDGTHSASTWLGDGRRTGRTSEATRMLPTETWRRLSRRRRSVDRACVIAPILLASASSADGKVGATILPAASVPERGTPARYRIKRTMRAR